MRNDHLPGMSVRAYGRIENHFMSKIMKNFCLEARLLFFYIITRNNVLIIYVSFLLIIIFNVKMI